MNFRGAMTIHLSNFSSAIKKLLLFVLFPSLIFILAVVYALNRDILLTAVWLIVGFSYSGVTLLISKRKARSGKVKGYA